MKTDRNTEVEITINLDELPASVGEYTGHGNKRRMQYGENQISRLLAYARNRLPPHGKYDPEGKAVTPAEVTIIGTAPMRVMMMLTIAVWSCPNVYKINHGYPNTVIDTVWEAER
jgi:hypothetical protein